MASRCTDSGFAAQSRCEAAGHVWCTDSPEDPETFMRCIDITGVTSAVEIIVAVGVLIAILMTGMVLTKRLIQAAGES